MAERPWGFDALLGHHFFRKSLTYTDTRIMSSKESDAAHDAEGDYWGSWRQLREGMQGKTFQSDHGDVAERPIAPGCKPGSKRHGGSNPSVPTIKLCMDGRVVEGSGLQTRRRKSTPVRIWLHAPVTLCTDGVMGSRAALRALCRKTCGFDSHSVHHALTGV